MGRRIQTTSWRARTARPPPRRRGLRLLGPHARAPNISPPGGPPRPPPPPRIVTRIERDASAGAGEGGRRGGGQKKGNRGERAAPPPLREEVLGVGGPACLIQNFFSLGGAADAGSP